MNLPRFSVRHPSLVWLLLVAVAAWGLLTYRTISRREDPEIKISVALVITIWPGKGAEDVERLVTKKLEDELEQLPDLKVLRSTTRENISLIFVDVEFATDTDLAWQKLRNKIAQARPELPAGIIGPDVMDDFGDVTSMIWTLSSTTAEPRELERCAEELRARLKRVDAVGKVNLLGVQEEVIYIEGPLDSFTLYNFNPLRAAQILDYRNVNLPAGYVRTPDRNLRLDVSGSFELVEEIGNAVIDVSKETGAPLKVRDVFSVRRAYREPPFSKMLTGGEPSVGLDVRMARGHNVVAMGEEVRRVAEAFATGLPPGITLTLAHDQPHEVKVFIDDFMDNLVEGLLIVVVVVALAMGLRSTLIVAVSLPMSIIATIALMPSFGLDLEMISIGAFIIALGMLVDNAIIITDNVDRHLEAGASPRRAAVDGAQELVGPVLSGTLATVGAFLPLLLMKDEMGAYIRALPIVVSVSMLASFLLAMTVTPLLAARLLKPRAAEAVAAAGERGLAARLYARFMRQGLKLRWVVLVVSLLCLIGAIRLIPVVGLSFFPEVDRDQFTVDIWLPEGAGVDATERKAREVDAILARHPEVLERVIYVGEGGPRFHITVVPQFAVLNYARIMVLTRDKNETRDLVERLKREVRTEVADARITVSNILYGVPVEAPIAIKIAGPDMDRMRTISQQVQQILRETPGTDLVRDNIGQEVQSLDVDIDAAAASMFGLSNTEVALTLLTVHEGLPVTDYRQEEDKIPILMRVRAEDRHGLKTLDEISVHASSTGAKVPLKAVATVTPEWAPGVIHRVDNRRTVTVLADLDGRLAADVLKEAWPKIDALQLPPGYSLRSEGEQKERDKAFGELSVIFALIIGALLLMLVIQFGSVKQGLTVLFSVPLAIIGAVVGLLVSGNSFSFMAFLGVVSLAGMVIKNAVVWVEFVNQAVAAGNRLGDAIIEAGIKRFRPILLTAATTIGGLLPLALFGGVLWAGMAWAMIFGLALATVLTLVVIPILFYLLFRRSVNRAVAAASNGAAGWLLAGLALAAGLGIGGPARAGEHPVQAYLRAAETHALVNRGARLDLEVAKAQRLQAETSFLPLPALQATATRLDRSLTFELDTSALGLPVELPPMVLAEQNVYQVAGTLTLPLYAGGVRFAYLAAAGHGVRAQEQVVEATRRGVAFGVLARYVQLLEAERLTRIWEARLAADERLVHVARRKLEAQLGVPFDVSYAEAIAADTERQLEEARGAARQRRHVFNDLVGRDLDAGVDLAELVPDPGFDPDAERLLAGVRGRAELKARAEGAAAQREMIRAALGDLLPTFALVGEAGYKQGDFGYVEGREYWQVTAALQWNVLLDGTAWARREEARVAAEKADLELTQARQQLELELTQAVQQHRDTVKIVAVAGRGVTTAAEGRRNAQKAYDEGVLPLNTLLEASRALVEARLNAARAHYGRVLTELQVRYVAGLPLLEAANLAAPTAEPPAFLEAPAPVVPETVEPAADAPVESGDESDTETEARP